MKKTLVILVVLAAAAGSAHAQVATPAAPASAGTRPAPDQMVERRAQYLAKELSLTADQQSRLQPILLAQRQQMQAMREQRTTGGRRLGVGQDLKTAQARFDEQLKAVFTPEQYAKFNQMQTEQREKLRERRANGQSAPPAEQ